MPVYRCVDRFVLLLHLLVLMAVYKHDIYTFSLLKSVQDSENLSLNVHLRFSFFKKADQGTQLIENTNWSLKLALSFSFIVFVYWLVFLLVLAGDVHPNPGPIMPPSLSSATSSSDLSKAPDSIRLCQNLSIVHYNVQSIFSKQPRTSSIVQFIFFFWSFEISGNILRNQKILYV